MKIYAIRDQKADFYLPLMEASNDAHAQRLVAQAISSGAGKQLAEHPADYQLYRLAEYDNVSGEIIADRPLAVASILQICQMYFTQPAQSDIEDEAQETVQEQT